MHEEWFLRQLQWLAFDIRVCNVLPRDLVTVVVGYIGFDYKVMLARIILAMPEARLQNWFERFARASEGRRRHRSKRWALVNAQLSRRLRKAFRLPWIDFHDNSFANNLAERMACRSEALPRTQKTILFHFIHSVWSIFFF